MKTGTRTLVCVPASDEMCTCISDLALVEIFQELNNDCHSGELPYLDYLFISLSLVK